MVTGGVDVLATGDPVGAVVGSEVEGASLGEGDGCVVTGLSVSPTFGNSVGFGVVGDTDGVDVVGARVGGSVGANGDWLGALVGCPVVGNGVGVPWQVPL